MDTIEEKLAALESKVNALAGESIELRKLHSSRRGPEGGRGEQGDKGEKGEPGKDGKDANMQELLGAIENEFKQIRVKFETRMKNLSAEMVRGLSQRGFLDQDGKAIVIPGPPGRDGADSNTPGPPGPAGRPGADGKSIVGPRGPIARLKIGTVSSGPEASVQIRVAADCYVLDFVLPRGTNGADSVVPGPKGDIGQEGPQGLQGLPGEGLSKEDVIRLVLDMKQRKTI